LGKINGHCRRAAGRSRSQSKLVFFVIFGLLTVFVTYMKNARVFDPTSEIAFISRR
jgi:hypothetical protein